MRRKNSENLVSASDKYVPALSYGLLTPLYDSVMKWAMRESTFKRSLVEQARVNKGHRVLDLGCGTATLTILIKRTQPEARVTGIDGDPRVLEIARSKVAAADLEITLDQGMAFDLPYDDCSFDRVLSSMVLHHLSRENKVRTLKEVLRVLRRGGEFHVADFGRPRNILMSLISLVMGRLEENSDNVRGLLPEMLRIAGFNHIDQTAEFGTLFGTVVSYKGEK